MLLNCALSCKECTSFNDGNAKAFIDKNQTDPGVKQEIVGTIIEKKDIKSHIDMMTKYRKEFINHPDTTLEMRSLCTNQLEKCAYYATKGLCEDKIVFMMDVCPLACMMCDKKLQFDECVGMRHPDNKPLFVNDYEFEILKNDETKEKIQTIDLFFTEGKDNSDWANYNSDYLFEPTNKENAEGTWLVKFENVLSADDCNALIELGKEIGFTTSTEHKSIDSKDAKNSKKQQQHTPTRSFKTAQIVKYLDTMEEGFYINVLTEIMERIAKITRIPIDYFEPPEINLYPESNGFYSFHHDFDPHESYQMAGHKMLSFYIPLSSVEAGGYLGFPRLDWMMIPPIAGQMIVWPNVFSRDNNEVNENVGKEILPVRMGDLYVLHIYAHQHDFKTADSRGCV